MPDLGATPGFATGRPRESPDGCFITTTSPGCVALDRRSFLAEAPTYYFRREKVTGRTQPGNRIYLSVTGLGHLVGRVAADSGKDRNRGRAPLHGAKPATPWIRVKVRTLAGQTSGRARYVVVP